MTDLRYLEDKEKFIAYAYDVLGRHFGSMDEFVSEFESISTDEAKNEFLRLVSFYKYLVKDGRFYVNERGEQKYVDYLDETHRYVALMSLIEALYSKEEFVDFYEWLRRSDRNSYLPIEDPGQLDELYKHYKSHHGAIQKAVRFFTDLDPALHWKLKRGVTQYKRKEISNGSQDVEELEATIEGIAKTLYQIRSDFVHYGKLVLELGGTLTLSRRGNRYLITGLSLDDLGDLFEIGILDFFRVRHR